MEVLGPPRATDPRPGGSVRPVADRVADALALGGEIVDGLALHPGGGDPAVGVRELELERLEVERRARRLHAVGAYDELGDQGRELGVLLREVARQGGARGHARRPPPDG